MKNAMKISINLSFILLMASEEEIFYFFPRKFSVSVAMATSQFQRFGEYSCGW